MIGRPRPSDLFDIRLSVVGGRQMLDRPTDR